MLKSTRGLFIYFLFFCNTLLDGWSDISYKKLFVEHEGPELTLLPCGPWNKQTKHGQQTKSCSCVTQDCRNDLTHPQNTFYSCPLSLQSIFSHHALSFTSSTPLKAAPKYEHRDTVLCPNMYKKKEANRASLLYLQFNLGDEIFAEFFIFQWVDLNPYHRNQKQSI